MAKKINENLDFGGVAKVINLPVPSSANDAARKADVDAIQSGFTWLLPARVVATANVTVASPGANIDGVALAINDRVLLTGQTNPVENGTYLFKGGSSAMVRTADPWSNGSVVPVGSDGTANKDTIWVQTTDAPVAGTTSLTFAKIGQVLSWGTGLQQSGNVVSLVTPVTVALGGTGGATAAAARGNLGVPGIYEQDFGGGTGTYAISHNLGTQYPTVVVVNNTTHQQEDCTITHTDANTVTLSSEAWAATPPAAAAYHVRCVG